MQRRNQKLVEEAPATKLTPRLRRRICNLALKLAKRIGYTNAGTIEFLLSPDGQLYFLEMNTRLQVEHGVTELITGVDLVELQIRVAAGEPLPLTQKDIKPHGHAIEVRIYPEDPETLIPDVGTITELHQPSGEHIRVDSALFKGYDVTLHYEPLLAKVMAWGETREEASQRLLRALLAFRMEGIKCNIPLLRDVLVSKDFASATHDTSSLARLLEGRKNDRHQLAAGRLMNGSRPEKADREIAAAIGVALALAMQHSQTPATQMAAASSWRVYGRREQIFSSILRNRGWR